MSIAEKPFLRKLQDGETPQTSAACTEQNYIIVKYSGKLKLPVPAEKTPDQTQPETPPEDQGNRRILEEVTGDERIVCISSGSSKITAETEESEFQFYFKEDETSLENIFSKYEPTKILSLDFSNYKLGELKNLNSLFKGCSSLTSVNFGGLKTETVDDMAGMFQNCTKLESVDLSQISTSSVKNMSSMFEDCSGLKSLNLSNFITSKVETMNSMFKGVSSVKSMDLSKFETTKVADMAKMFSGCKELVSLDISNFNLQGLKIDTKPTGDDTKPTGDDTKPTGDDTKPTGDDTKPTGDDTKPTGDGRRLNENQGDDTKPAEDDTKPAEDDTKPAEDDTNPAEDDTQTGPSYQMFYGLSNLKYISLINITDPNDIISNSDLKDITGLTACQKEKILEKATNQCCTFDIEEKKCPNIPVTTTINEISTTTVNEKTTTDGIKETTSIPTIPKTTPQIPNLSGLPIFTIDSINQDECEKTGKLTLNGKYSKTISGPIKYTLPLSYPSGISLSCTLSNDKSECETDRVINDKISISQTNITGYDGTAFIIPEFSPQDTVKCSNALIGKATSKLSVNIAFRQVSHFQTNANDYSFSFYLITLVSQVLSQGYSLNLKMDVVINKVKTEKNAVCTLQENVSPSSGELAQGNFNCKVQLTSDEYSNTNFDKITISPENEEINGVSDLDETLSNPKKTDEKIQEIKAKKARGEDITDLEYIADYYEEEVKPTPQFTINSINVEKCNSGKFILTGYFSDDITESMKFDFTLTYPLTEVKCEFDEAEKNEVIEMTCKLHSSFSLVESILIEQKLIKKKNKEIFIIQRKEFTFTENLQCSDYNTAKIQKIQNRKKSNFSFLQLGHFFPRLNFFSFFMALARISQSESFMASYPLTVKLKIAGRRRLRSLDSTASGIGTTCKLNQTLQTSSAAGYDCSNTGSVSGTPKSMELETDDLDSIQGVPDNANPDKMNNKIDLSNLDNLKAIENVPSANINEISGSSCSTNGEYKVTATLDKNTNLKSGYDNVEFRFSAPESSGICTTKISGTNVEMTCQNKEKFYESKIYTERQLVQDAEGNGLFFVNSYESTNTLECDVSLKTGSITTPDTTDGADTGGENRVTFHKKDGSGLSGGAIAGIVIASVVVVAAAAIAIVLAKKGAFSGKDMVSNNNSSVVNFGNKAVN